MEIRVCQFLKTVFFLNKFVKFENRFLNLKKKKTVLYTEINM